MPYTLVTPDTPTTGQGSYTLITPPTVDPTEGMSGMDKFMAGFGKSFADLGAGAKSLFADAAAKGYVPGISGDEQKSWATKAQQYRQEADEQKRLDAPLMNTGAGIGGNIAGAIASSAAIPVGGAATALGRLGMAAGAGGLLGALQPVGVDDSRTANAALSAGTFAAGQGAANLIGAVVRPAVATDPARAAAQQFAQNIGGDMSMGQISGNNFVQRMEQMIANLPGGRGFYKNLAAKNEAAGNNVINDLTGGGAGDAIDRFGAGKSVTLDPAFFDELKNVSGKFQGLADRDAPNSALKTIEQYVGTSTPNPALAGFNPTARAQAIAQGVPEFASGQAPKFTPGQSMPMTGPYGDFNNYQALRSLYGKREFRAGDPADQAAYGAIKDAFDSTAVRSLEQAGVDPAELAKLRAAYAIERTVAPAKTIGPNDEATYNLQKLAQIVKQKDVNQPSFFNNLPGDLGDTLRQLANFGAVTKPINSSGTAENSIAGKVASMEILKDLMSGEGFHAALATAGTLLGGPWLANTLLQSTRKGIPLLRDTPEAAQLTLRQLMSATPSAYLNATSAGQ